MGKVIYSQVYFFNPKKDVIMEIDGEDYKNLVDGNSSMIKHPIKFIGVDKHKKIRERFDEISKIGDNCFVSTPWGFFLKKPEGDERLGLSREREQEIYLGLMDYFVTEKFAVYEAKRNSDSKQRR